MSLIMKLKSAAPAMALAGIAALTLLSAIDSALACKGKHGGGEQKPGRHSSGQPKPYSGNPGPIGPVPQAPLPTPTGGNADGGAKPPVVIRDHRAPRDRSAEAVVRDHRTQPLIRDHRKR
jgi:hypothetical protein